MPRGSKGEVASIRDARREMYRQQILAAAEYEFAKTGFVDTRVNTIAATADISLATLYKNFTGKDEIWNALNGQRMDELVAMVREVADHIDSPLEGILASARAEVDFFAQHPNFLRLHVKEGWSWATADELGRGGQRQVWHTGIDMLTRAVAAAVQAGELAEDTRPVIMAKLAISALQVLLTDWADNGAARPAADVADELVAHLQRILNPATSTTARP